MENSNGQKPISHTYQARSIINQLTVAYLNTRAPTFDVTVESQHNLNTHSSVFVFKSPTIIPGVKSYYSDFSLLGRHYLLTTPLYPGLRRYYTTCNCMQPGIYEEYIRVIHEVYINNNLCHFDETMFSQADTDRVALVIKNYMKVGGMSE
jgi:hypothetical protein